MHWNLDDIRWDAFDAAKVDRDILRIVKAASLVEHNSGDYVTYLCNVFAGDPDFQDAARTWGREELQHGRALARWAALADPAFDFDASFADFTAGFSLPVDARESVRGSRAGELIARCIVECGTSSFFSAIRDATDAPVLKDICHRIAGDEFRHYRLFQKHFRRYQKDERLPFLARVQVALGRVHEAGDDELAMAYYHANRPDGVYDRARWAGAYELRATRLYRQGHIARMVAMCVKAVDLDPQGRLCRLLQRGAWHGLQFRRRLVARRQHDGHPA